MWPGCEMKQKPEAGHKNSRSFLLTESEERGTTDS